MPHPFDSDPRFLTVVGDLAGGATAYLRALGATSVAWLLAHADENGDGVAGWVLPLEQDAGGDGTPNPANTEYAITSAIVVDALLDHLNTQSGPARADPFLRSHSRNSGRSS